MLSSSLGAIFWYINYLSGGKLIKLIDNSCILIVPEQSVQSLLCGSGSHPPEPQSSSRPPPAVDH
jgi:hypothetical protein